jgi:hypothetical protein
MSYTIARTQQPPPLGGNWEDPAWQRAATLAIDHFRPESSDHHPVVQARLLYDDQALYVFFRVQDRYVRCVHTNYLDPVCVDSCVEFFVRPRADRGYINFEVNCGGALHSSYIEDPTRTPAGFARFEFLPEELGRQVQIAHSLPRVVEPEIAEPVEWSVAYCVPLALFETYVGPLGPLSGQQWRANFYKCADQTSHPHWAAWSPVQELNFHRPQDFGIVTFA